MYVCVSLILFDSERFSIACVWWKNIFFLQYFKNIKNLLIIVLLTLMKDRYKINIKILFLFFSTILSLFLNQFQYLFSLLNFFGIIWSTFCLRVSFKYSLSLSYPCGKTLQNWNRNAVEQNFQRASLPLQSLNLGLHLFLGKDDIYQLDAKLVKFGDVARCDGRSG